MIISRTPFRISFFGGGTDYPAWYRQHGGAVLAATIDKYCYLTCRYLPPFFEHKYRVVWSKIDTAQTIDDIQHLAVRGILRHFNFERGLEIHHDGDLPARSGMGSSSAFTVGLLNALHALQGQMFSKHQLATESIYVEQELLQEVVGSQDQVCAAYGGLNHILFLPNNEISVCPVTVSRERVYELESHLMMFYTGIKRTAANIAESYVTNINDRKRQLRILKDMVEEALAILGNRQDLRPFGELLHESWEFKRSLSAKVSNSEIDEIYTAALKEGALGGKLTGAGGGGFMLLFVPPEYQERVRQRLSQLIYVPFKFEFSGTQIIFFDPEEDYAAAERERVGQTVQAFHELALEE
jgi:D-glycero-alpha-D-manno-heptose-7-phosphate kinase